VPSAPSVSELTLRLKFSTLMLPVYVHYNGDIDLDLEGDLDPLRTIAEGINMPDLVHVPFSRHAWARGPPPQSDEEEAQFLNELAVMVHHMLYE